MLKLQVMSFNIRCGPAEDGPNSWPYRRDLTASLIASRQPQIVGLQEAFDFQNAFLLEQLPSFSMIGEGRDSGADEFCTILMSPGLTAHDSGTFWFSPTPDEPGEPAWGARIRRICTWALFDAFAFYNLHLDHEAQESREQSIELLLSRVHPGPAVITGDFNSFEDNPAIAALRSAGWRDTYRVVHPDGECRTFNGYLDPAPPGKIDYIWVSPHWQVLGSELVQDRPDGRWASDHFPIVATIALP